MPKAQYDQLVAEYQSGKPMKTILQENPWAKKNTIYSRVKKSSEPNLKLKVEEPETPENSLFEEPQRTKSTPKSTPKLTEMELFEITDDLFNDKSVSKMQNDDFIMSEFGNLLNDPVDEGSFDPQNIMESIGEEKRAEDRMASDFKMPSKSSWLKWPKFTGEKKPKTKEQISEEVEESKFKKIYEIRLYLYNFDLDDLHIIGGNREKFLVGLYTKKEAELNKILHFIKFHVRFNNKQISKSLIENGFFTACKAIEIFSGYLGLQTEGFTDKIREDQEIDRLIKEIAIEFEATKPNFGPKTDLGLKILSNLAQVDASNRLNPLGEKKKSSVEKIKKDLDSKEVKKETVEKYQDL